tara:strand:- start:811 stop:1155 length:345 start_codon:yes stop_codon:yes gene_type:complete
MRGGQIEADELAQKCKDAVLRQERKTILRDEETESMVIIFFDQSKRSLDISMSGDAYDDCSGADYKNYLKQIAKELQFLSSVVFIHVRSVSFESIGGYKGDILGHDDMLQPSAP